MSFENDQIDMPAACSRKNTSCNGPRRSIAYDMFAYWMPQPSLPQIYGTSRLLMNNGQSVANLLTSVALRRFVPVNFVIFTSAHALKSSNQGRTSGHASFLLVYTVRLA